MSGNAATRCQRFPSYRLSCHRVGRRSVHCTAAIPTCVELFHRPRAARVGTRCPHTECRSAHLHRRTQTLGARHDMACQHTSSLLRIDATNNTNLVPAQVAHVVGVEADVQIDSNRPVNTIGQRVRRHWVPALIDHRGTTWRLLVGSFRTPSARYTSPNASVTPCNSSPDSSISACGIVVIG